MHTCIFARKQGGNRNGIYYRNINFGRRHLGHRKHFQGAGRIHWGEGVVDSPDPDPARHRFNHLAGGRPASIQGESRIAGLPDNQRQKMMRERSPSGVAVSV